jgi:ribulose-5-phosphate 4-epimerase/fuculose-1-phosphate aldolase
MTPVASAISRTAKPSIRPAEWEQRVNLAACYRLVEHFGWTDLIYTHISARVPGAPGHFLLNRFGLLFDEVTASNLIKVGLDSSLSRSPRAMTRASSSTARSSQARNVDCVIHTHSRPASRSPP